jgi:hypothetical protein
VTVIKQIDYNLKQGQIKYAPIYGINLNNYVLGLVSVALPGL